jgi:adenine phosphoribosyltransferase
MNPLYYLEHIDLKACAKPDFTTLFADPKVFNNLTNDLVRPFRDDAIDKVACPEAIGFILGSAVARRMKKPLIPIRKGGKLPTLPGRVARHAFTDYTKEKNSFEVNKSLISPGDRVLIVDDWSETGGQLKGLIGLLKKRGAVIAGISLLGFNQIRRTRHLEKNYKLRAIIEHTIEGERDLTKPLA